MYSQNKEEALITLYFKGRVSLDLTVLDIGANDGLTFSNSLALVEAGWNAVLLEPSKKAFRRLQKLHHTNKNVLCLNYGLSTFSGKQIFYENGAYEEGGKDVSLLSTMHESELERWGDTVKFKKTEAEFCTWIEFERMVSEKKGTLPTFNCITIDAEGNDLEILKMIDLQKVGCELLCIEWNSVPEMEREITKICDKFGMREIHRNAENLIFVK